MFPFNFNIGRGRGRGLGRGRGVYNIQSEAAVVGMIKMHREFPETPISQPGFITQPRKIAYESDKKPWTDISENTTPEQRKEKSPSPTSKTSNSRKNRYYRKDEPKEELEEFFTKMLPKNYHNRFGIAIAGGSDEVEMISPKPPPEVHPGVSLEDIPSPPLMLAEETLSDFEQQLVIIYKKCMAVSRFDIIPPTYFSLWFAPDEDVTGINITRITSGEGPHKFYLMPRRNVYIHAITQNWLKSLVDTEKIEEIESDELEELKGGWVAAIDEDGNWHRAKVIEVYCGESVSVVYPDLGDTCHALRFDRLRHLPGNLWDHPGLCFHAALAGISKDDAEWDSNESINKGFIQLLESLDFLNAEMVRVDKNGVVEVNLWEIDSVGMTINERAQRIITDWSQDIRYGLTPDDIQKVTIKENTAVLFDKTKLWQIVKVVTPSYFTVKLANSLDKWKEKMQNFYDGLDRGRLTIRQGRVEPLQCYAYYLSANSSWNRVQIITSDNEKKTCQIYYWDLGTYNTVEFDNLRKLLPQFCSQPPEAHRCHLVHILADKKNHNGQPAWSQNAIDEFSKLAPEKAIMTGVIVTSDTIPIKNVGMRLNLGVILLEETYDRERNPNSLQHKLCELNLATADGIAAGGWNDLQKFQKYIVSSPQISPVFMNKSSPLLWKKTRDYYTEWDPNATEYRKFMPMEIRKNLCWVKITMARSPTCVFVQIQEQIPALMFMMSRLCHYVKNECPLDESTIKPGLFIAVFCRLTGQSDDAYWYRAIVTQVLPNIKVVLIDFAIPCIIAIENTRLIPKKFLSQPSFAHRVHIDFPNLVPKFENKYSQECCDFFRKYVKVWNSACPIYYIWRRKESQVVELEDIYQNLQYNSSARLYERCELQPEDILLAQLKNNPILSHLFVSVGVIIEYEHFNRPDQPYTFSLLHKILVDRQFASYECNMFILLSDFTKNVGIN